MRRFNFLLLLIPVALLVGCNGVVIGPVTPSPELQVDQELQLQPEPAPEPQLDKGEVLVFSAKWCAACIKDKPYIEAMREQGVKVTIIDYDENPEIFAQYGVTQMPTYIVLDENGDEIERTGSIIAVLSIISVILKIVIFLLG